MNDKESLKMLAEIRDEMKQMNAQIKWLTDKAAQAIAEEEQGEKSMLKVAELENKKSKKDLLTIAIIFIGLGAWFALEQLGLL